MEGSPETDRAALLDLYNETGGPYWKNNLWWQDNDLDLRNWYGVTTDSDGRVVKLELFGNNLRGSIPSSLENLTRLTWLYLSGNQLNGFTAASPSMRVRCEALMILRRWELDLGSIPSSLGNLTQLTALSLGDNQLNGSIPSSLGNLTRLTELWLYNNQLSGVIPKELIFLARLDWLYLSGNDFDGGPVEDMTRGQISPWMQRKLLRGEDEHSPSWAFQAVQVLTSLWHFLLPVLDDITDLVLLWQTFDSTSPTLWWICAVVFAVADYERLYVAFFVIVFLARALLYRLCCCCNDTGEVLGYNSRELRMLAFGQEVDLDEAWMLFVDSVLWVLFGSRARSGDLMRQLGLAGEAPVETLNRGSGNNAIDVLVYYHPFRYFGAFVMSFPRKRGLVTRTRRQAHRRTTAMVRAVGETLVVDPLFLALSVVSGGWDDNFTGFTFISGMFSILELMSELQYYITEAEHALPYSAGVKRTDDRGSGGAVSSPAVGQSV